MENIVIFGLGQDYNKSKKDIERKYNVVGYSDNNLCLSAEFDLFIEPEQVAAVTCDKILICTRKYFNFIKIQLVDQLGIDVTKIIGMDDLVEEDKGYVNKKFKKIIADLKLYKEINNNSKFAVRDDSLSLIESDVDEAAGKPCPHYFAQDIWGAQKILKNCPKEHYDIGSRLDGFIAHLLVFRTVNYIDVRPLPYKIPNLNFICGDATNLEGFEDGVLESISSFHAIEHFGLGRYGEAINPEACFLAMRNMVRVVKPGGHIYLGLPIGPEDKLIFNSDRIFCVRTILNHFAGTKLIEARIIQGDNAYTEDLMDKDWDNIADFSCGLFEFLKE